MGDNLEHIPVLCANIYSIHSIHSIHIGPPLFYQAGLSLGCLAVAQLQEDNHVVELEGCCHCVQWVE